MLARFHHSAEYFGTIPPSITATPQTFPFYIHIGTDHAFFGVEKVVGAPELPNFGLPWHMSR